MNRTEHLLSCLAEECAEVAQRVSKALRFGLAEVQPGQPLTNAQRISQEFHDLLAVIEMLEDEGALDRPTDMHAIERKKAKVEAFLGYSAQCGTLDQQGNAELAAIHEIACCGWANVLQHPITPEDTLTVRDVKIMAMVLIKDRPTPEPPSMEGSTP